MTESDRELSKKTHRKWFLLIFLAGIPVAFLAGIVYINNRDFIPRIPRPVSNGSKDSVQLVTDSGQELEAEDVVVKEDSVPSISRTVPEPVVFSEILCEVSDRRDILLKVTVELFFADELMRPEILIRRNEIKILVKRVLRKEMGLVKKELLEPELFKVVNGIFSQEVLTDIILKDIQIEKVANQ